MQTFNYHTHTYRCNHASGSDEEYVQAAIKAGYKVLGFSDHAPYHNLPLGYARMEWDLLEDYINSINSLKEKYKDQIEIHLGLETEYYPEYLEEKKELYSKVEYLILGQHFYKANGDGSYFLRNTEEEIEKYADYICEALDTGMFTYLCHPDVYVYRQPVFDATCQKTARRIIEKAVETNTPLEVNVHGIYRGKPMFPTGEYEYNYPHKDFWRIAAEYPVRCLYGIDAHKPEQLLDKEVLILAEEELADLNLTFIKEPLI